MARARKAQTEPTQETATAPAPASATATASTASAAEVSPSATSATDQTPTSEQTASVSTPPAESEVQSVGLDLSSGPDQTVVALTDSEGRLVPATLTDAAMAISATSSRAPYTRGGIHFASTRTAITLPETTTPDQTRRLVADTAITLSLVHVASGQAVILPRDLFDAEGQPDFDRVAAINEDLLRQVVEGKA